MEIDAHTYQARIRARQEERATEPSGKREARAARARARSARRWEGDASDQQRRAGRLQLIVGEGADGELNQAS